MRVTGISAIAPFTFPSRASSPSHVWHLDEVVVTISGKNHWLWRGVDQDGHVLDEIVRVRRDIKAARRPLIRLLHDQDVRTDVGGQR